MTEFDFAVNRAIDVGYRLGFGVKVDKYPRAPSLNLNGLQTNRFLIPVFDAFKFRRPHQPDLKVIRPAVILALQALSIPAALGDHSRPMRANIIKRA